jgi:hypothetical protein
MSYGGFSAMMGPSRACSSLVVQPAVFLAFPLRWSGWLVEYRRPDQIPLSGDQRKKGSPDGLPF